MEVVAPAVTKSLQTVYGCLHVGTERTTSRATLLNWALPRRRECKAVSNQRPVNESRAREATVGKAAGHNQAGLDGRGGGLVKVCLYECCSTTANLLDPLDPDAVIADVQVVEDVGWLVLPEDSVNLQQASEDAGLPWAHQHKQQVFI